MRDRPIPRVDVLGVGISAINMSQAVHEIRSWISRGAHHYVCVTGVHGVMESQRDPALRDIHNRSGLSTPDGMPMVWAARWAGAKSVERVYGPELMIELAREAAVHGWRMFLYGGKPGVADLLSSRLRAQVPGVQIVGTFCPPFRPLSEAERLEHQRLINSARPHLVWVGMSTPKQERWMAENIGGLTANVLIGVGAAFDIHAGLAKSAPQWIQRMGMEWFYRLLREPKRLWRRYVYNNPRFVLRILRQRPTIIA